LGGEQRGGKRGRGTPDTVPFITAVETTADGRPLKMKLNVVAWFQRQEISRWSQRQLEPHSTVVTDGLACFKAGEDNGCQHEIYIQP
jgi:hypothetical protein